MNTVAAQDPKSLIDTEAFAFVQALASELSRGKVDLPSFPDIALRVRQVLADEDVSQDQVVRVVGSEPALAARLMQIANSAAINFTGKPITELRTAINRMGFNMVRSASIAFAMSQLKKAENLKGLEEPLDELWKRSAAVAAMSHAVAKRYSRINPDTAMLSGLLHCIGKLYILTRSTRHPALFADQDMYQHIVNDWHGSIAKVLLESWGMAEEIVTAVNSYTDDSRQGRGPTAMLADVLEVAVTLAPCKQMPQLLGERIGPLKAAMRLELTAEICEALLAESAEELAALRAALGQ